MKVKVISEEIFENFVNQSNKYSFYESSNWKKFKENEGKTCELVGLYDDDFLVGASLIIYTKVHRFINFAYASRGFVYDFKNIKQFKDALVEYFKSKKVTFLKMDPLIVLKTYDTDLTIKDNENAKRIVEDLKNNGFIEVSYKNIDDYYQFKMIHHIKLEDSWDKQLELMNKSTKKNIELALFRGMMIEEVTEEKLDDVLKYFDLTSSRKNFHSLSKNFYNNLLKEFKDGITLYLVYIDRETYVTNLKNKITSLEREQMEVNDIIERGNQGTKLLNKVKLINEQITKYQNELKDAKSLDEKKYVSSMVTITKYKEVVSFASGMDSNYRKFNPKYIMYPEMIKKAINEKLEYVNFLGVKNILDKNDPDYGIYEVKRGFGGETVEFIGEFDLPINKNTYKLYEFLNRKN